MRSLLLLLLLVSTPLASCDLQRDPYAVLGLRPGCSQKQIKAAHRKLALAYHPDKTSPKDAERHAQLFREAQEAFEALSDEATERSRLQESRDTGMSFEQAAAEEARLREEHARRKEAEAEEAGWLLTILATACALCATPVLCRRRAGARAGPRARAERSPVAPQSRRGAAAAAARSPRPQAAQAEADGAVVPRSAQRKPPRRESSDAPPSVKPPVSDPLPAAAAAEPARALPARGEAGWREWSSSERQALTKAMKAMPVGTPRRWEAVAESMGGARSPADCAAQAKQAAPPRSGDSYEAFLCDRKGTGAVSAPAEVRAFDAAAEAVSEADTWTAEQDAALVAALKATPQGSVAEAERWRRVAALVPGGRSAAACAKRLGALRKMLDSNRQATTT
jgi:DnaJ family protein C protein 2